MNSIDKLSIPGLDVHTSFTIKTIATLLSHSYAPNFVFKGEIHDEWELVYVNMGEVEILAGDQTFLVPARHFFLHSPAEFHAIRANNCNCNVLICAFRLAEGENVLSPLCQKANKVSSGQMPLLSGIMHEYDNNFQKFNFFDPSAPTALSPEKASSLHVIRNYLEIFFLYALHAAEASASVHTTAVDGIHSQHNDIVSAINQYLGQHLSQHFSLEDLARSIGYSQSYLSKTFRRITGTSISEYLMSQRISRAKFFMSDHTLSLSDIAFRTGFGSLQAFSKMFKQKTGYSPSAYRKSLEIHQLYDF